MSEIEDAIKAYRRWRKRHTFATRDIEIKASLVERDLETLPRLQSYNTDTLALIQRNVFEFEETLKRHPAMPRIRSARNDNVSAGDAIVAAGIVISAS